MTDSTDGVLSFDSLNAALTRCMAAHPPEGIEKALHPEANSMADLFCVMLWEKLASVPLAQVKASTMEAYEKWKPQQ